jgi:hypothetical protein
VRESLHKFQINLEISQIAEKDEEKELGQELSQDQTFLPINSFSIASSASNKMTSYILLSDTFTRTFVLFKRDYPTVLEGNDVFVLMATGAESHCVFSSRSFLVLPDLLISPLLTLIQTSS